MKTTALDRNGRTHKRNGQYSASLESLCACGHTMGQHTAERPHLCIAADHDETIPVCECEGFSRKK